MIGSIAMTVLIEEDGTKVGKPVRRPPVCIPVIVRDTEMAAKPPKGTGDETIPPIVTVPTIVVGGMRVAKSVVKIKSLPTAMEEDIGMDAAPVGANGNKTLTPIPIFMPIAKVGIGDGKSATSVKAMLHKTTIGQRPMFGPRTGARLSRITQHLPTGHRPLFTQVSLPLLPMPVTATPSWKIFGK